MANEGDTDNLWYKLCSILFERWWAALLLGPAILAVAACWFWDVVEAPWAELHPIDIYQEVLQGVFALGLALVGLVAISLGLCDLLSGSSDRADSPSAPPAEPGRTADQERE